MVYKIFFSVWSSLFVLPFYSMSTEQSQKAAAPKQHRSSGKHNKLVREVVHELAGWAPYERRAMDIIKLGKTKTARAFLKKRLGTHSRAMHKLHHLEDVIQEENMHHAHHHKE